MARFRTGEPGPALKHGARSTYVALARSVEVGAEVRNHLAENVTHLTPADEPVIDALVDVLSRLSLLRDYLDRSGGNLITARGGVKACAGLYVQLTRLALELASKLGLTPTSRAQAAKVSLRRLVGTADQRQTQPGPCPASLRLFSKQPGSDPDLYSKHRPGGARAA